MLCAVPFLTTNFNSNSAISDECLTSFNVGQHHMEWKLHSYTAF